MDGDPDGTLMVAGSDRTTDGAVEDSDTTFSLPFPLPSGDPSSIGIVAGMLGSIGEIGVNVAGLATTSLVICVDGFTVVPFETFPAADRSRGLVRPGGGLIIAPLVSIPAPISASPTAVSTLASSLITPPIDFVFSLNNGSNGSIPTSRVSQMLLMINKAVPQRSSMVA